MSEHLAHCDKQADFENCLCIEEKVVVLEAQLYQTKNELELMTEDREHWADSAERLEKAQYKLVEDRDDYKAKAEALAEAVERAFMPHDPLDMLGNFVSTGNAVAKLREALAAFKEPPCPK